MVWLGKKVFDMRHQLSVKRKLIPEDEEKPFLDHLEDLRKSLSRIVATLLIGMVVCFLFKEEIFKIIERPINAADIGVMDKEKSPLGLKTPEEWPKVAAIAYGLLGLDEKQRGVYLQHAFTDETEHLRPVVNALLLLHASQNLPKESRPAYVQAAAGGNETLLSIIRDMEEKKVDTSFERGPKHMNLRFFKPGEGFNLSMKLSLYAGIVIGFPLLVYFLLEFIVPGLRQEERRILWPSLAVGFGLFLGGVFFAYSVVTPNALRFLYNYDLSLGGTTEYRFTDYASFVVQFTLIFGLCFELPVIVYALNKLGILSYQLMKNTRSYAIIIIVVIAALLTPTTDLVNLSLLAVPMVFLYEISIWIAYFHDKAVKKRETEEEAAEEAAREARRARANMAGAYLEPTTHGTTDPIPSPSNPIDGASPSSHHDDATDYQEEYHPRFHDDYHHPEPDQTSSNTPAQEPNDHGVDTSSPLPQPPESGLTGPPRAEVESYKDRAAPWPAAPATDHHASPPSAAQAEPPSPLDSTPNRPTTPTPPAAHTEPPTAHTEPPAAQAEPPAAQAEPPTAQAEPPTAQAEPPAAQAEPPTAQAETPTRSTPLTEGEPSEEANRRRD
jgi:sec-independent protein translocase protein TatC